MRMIEVELTRPWGVFKRGARVTLQPNLARNLIKYGGAVPIPVPHYVEQPILRLRRSRKAG